MTAFLDLDQLEPIGSPTPTGGGGGGCCRGTAGGGSDTDTDGGAGGGAALTGGAAATTGGGGAVGRTPVAGIPSTWVCGRTRRTWIAAVAGAPWA